MSADVSVVALLAAYNEADIIGHVVSDLIAQDVQVYFLDDGSTDGTRAAVEPHLGRGVLAIERLSEPAADGATKTFDWERILLRKTQLAKELDADWFIHHDADEFRESPWPHVSLKQAIARVDALGFNAIDFRSLDFWPTDTDEPFRPGQDVRTVLTAYADGAPYDRIQIRCWKKAADLDLASTGGHEARFSGRRVFPLRFILRHYPIRGQAHGERKVFDDRRKGFLERERARGWHVQYDGMPEGARFIRDPSTLARYDAEVIRLELALRHRGVEELEASANDLRLDLERARADLKTVSAELEATRGGLQSMRQEAEVLRAALESREAEARAEDERWRQALADATRRLEAFERSLSWRWTAPARAIYRLWKR